MAKQEVTLQNFSGGELSENMYGRWDLPITNNGCRRLENFIAETQGPARFRSGFRYVRTTRRNKIACLIKFEFNDEQAYELEFTSGYLRFYKDEAVITESAKTITGATQASPGVITIVGHGYATGDEIFIENVGGMTQLNNKFYLVVKITNDTFSLQDQDGNAINTTGYSAYTSGGTTKRVYEITTPYTEANDLFKLRVDQNADTMYIVHPYYEPRKLTRTGHTAWTLSLYTRTADPFLDKKAIDGVSQANPAVVTTAAAHGYSTGQVVIIEGVAGMTEINSQPYKITVLSGTTFSLQDLNGNNINSSGFTAYAGSANDYASKYELLPNAITFYESRLWFGVEDKFHGSRSPDNTGTPRYDDFTNGTDADHAVEYTIADSEVNKIFWLKGTDRLLFAGTFGSEIKITGETDDKPITPTSVNVKAVNRAGVSDIAPIGRENSVIYIQRGKRTTRSFEFDALSDAFVSVDRNLVSDHITEGNVKQMTWQSGRPTILWMVKDDGELLGVTYKSREDVSGWHRHRTNRGTDKFLSVSTMPRSTGYEQIWVVVERIINGTTRRYVEFLADDPVIPKQIDFFTAKENKASDTATFLRAMAEAQKSYIHVDSALTYDGSDLGLNAGATVTPAAVSGSAVVFTAGAAVFTSAHVGREIWKKPVKGAGYGRAKITGYTDPTHVTCEIIQEFDSITAMAAGNWYMTAISFAGLDHLEARSLAIIADGGKHADKTVASGAVTLEAEASVAHFGIGYTGFLQPMSIEIAGLTGPSQTKPRNVYRVGIKFLNSLGCEVGTDLYAPEEVSFSDMPLVVGGPDPLFTGVKLVPYSDNWETDKLVYVRQTKPLPCIVQLIAVYGECDNE